MIIKRCLPVLLGFFILPWLCAQPAATGAEVVLKSNVIDLRENPQLRTRGANGAERYYTMDDLVVGSVFIDAENNARKVTAIYEDNGQTVIETITPDIEEVVEDCYLPDREIAFTENDIIPGSLGEGVTLANGPSRAALPQQVSWLDTDPDWEGKKIISVNIDMLLYKSDLELLELTKMIDEIEENKKKQESESGNQEAGNEEDNSPEVEVNGEVRLVGTLRILDPILKAGVKKPVMRVTWVKVWWHFGYPSVSFEDGYIHTSFDFAQQFDFQITGTVSLSAEKRVPIYGLAKEISGFKFYIGVYLKFTLDGTLSVCFEVSEYNRFNIWGTTDLVWPFIPKKVRSGSSRYFNFAFRPYISAEVELKSGVYAGLGGSVYGVDIVEAELGGGLYADANGYLEPRGILGYASDFGSYGSFSDWLYRITLELGAYLEANLALGPWDIELFQLKWPFYKWETSGDL